jgi:hypothetical protein
MMDAFYSWQVGFAHLDKAHARYGYLGTPSQVSGVCGGQACTGTVTSFKGLGSICLSPYRSTDFDMGTPRLC